MKSKITFFDLETTGKNPVTAEILTGYFLTLEVDFDRNSYEFISDLHVKLKPQNYIEEAFAIHKISKEEAFTFPSREIGLRAICRYIEQNLDAFMCCHANASIFGRFGHYDWTVMASNVMYISDKAYFWFNSKFRDVKVISTHTIAKKVLGLQKNDLKSLCENMGIPLDNHHSEKDDAISTMLLFKSLVDGLKIETPEDLYDLGHYSGTRAWSKNLLLI